MGKREGIQLAYPFEEERLAKWNPPYIVQPKLDGERCRAIWSESYGYVLVSSEFNTFVSVPHINKMLNSTYGVRELDGELYVHGLSFPEIHSIVSRTANLHPDYEKMEFHVFDVINDNPQFERLQELQQVLTLGPIKRVSCVIATTLDEVMDAHAGFMKDGYEGMIVRHIGAPYRRARSVYMMKFKPKKDDYYLITGYLEEHAKDGSPNGRLGRLLCTGDDGTEFPVYSGFPDKLREELWEDRENLAGKFCHVYYQNIISKSGKPRHATVLPKLGPVISVVKLNPEKESGSLYY